MGLAKGQHMTHPRNPNYDAYVLYKGDNVVGIFDTLDEVATFTGVARITAAQWSRPGYRKAYDEGKKKKDHYLVQPVKFDRDDI